MSTQPIKESEFNDIFESIYATIPKEWEFSHWEKRMGMWVAVDTTGRGRLFCGEETKRAIEGIKP